MFEILCNDVTTKNRKVLSFCWFIFFVLLYHRIFSKNVTWNWNSELNRSRVSKQYFNITRFYIYLFEVFMLKVGPYVKMNLASIYDQENQVIIFYIYRKRCIFAALSLRATINIFIQVIFPNVITYRPFARVIFW